MGTKGWSGHVLWRFSVTAGAAVCDCVGGGRCQ